MFKKSRIIVLALCCCALLCSCSFAPPDVESVTQEFYSNYADIETVIDFMISQEYESIIINDDSGMMTTLKYGAYYVEKLPISDEKVLAAVSNLLSGSYKNISKSANTITLRQWSSSSQISVGISYSIDGAHTPDVEYATEIVPLSEDGWYYYVADYNKWRTQQN